MAWGQAVSWARPIGPVGVRWESPEVQIISLDLRRFPRAEQKVIWMPSKLARGCGAVVPEAGAGAMTWFDLVGREKSSAQLGLQVLGPEAGSATSRSSPKAHIVTKKRPHMTSSVKHMLGGWSL